MRWYTSRREKNERNFKDNLYLNISFTVGTVDTNFFYLVNNMIKSRK